MKPIRHLPFESVLNQKLDFRNVQWNFPDPTIISHEPIHFQSQKSFVERE